MKNYKGFLIPENVLDLTLAQVVQDITIKNQGADENARLMALIGIDLDNVMIYTEIIASLGKEKKGDVFYPINLIEKIPAYAKDCKDLKVEGVSFEGQFNIFEMCTVGSLAHLEELIDTIYTESNPPQMTTAMEGIANKEAIENFENAIYLRYLAILPELIATVVLGAKSMPLDTLSEVKTRVAAMSAVKLLKIESAFFFLIVKSLMARHSPNLAACLNLLETLPASKNTFGLTNRILLQVRALTS